MHDNITHHGYDSDYDAIAPRSYEQPTEVRHTGPSTEEFLVKGRDIFCTGLDDYEFDYELTLFVTLDNGQVDTLGELKKQFVHEFRPRVAGVEMHVDIHCQRHLFAKCFETPRGREQLRQLCKQANGE